MRSDMGKTYSSRSEGKGRGTGEFILLVITHEGVRPRAVPWESFNKTLIPTSPFSYLRLMTRLLPFLLFLSLLIPANAETVKDREGAVRSDKAKMSANDRWIYNDIEAGFAEAKKSGRPLMVVLRCVPCVACMGIDTEVLTENEGITPLMDKFVRVRVINANALDLSLFQFDYDLSFSILFFNADKTIYGRFGSWEHQHDSQNRATSTLRQAMERTLALHAGYPANAPSLAGKKGQLMAYKTPIEMPSLKTFRPELDWNGQVVKSCVHCHQVGDAIRLEVRDTGAPLPMKWIFPCPNPGALGITFGEEPVTGVSEVADGSVAARAGIRAGDEIVSLDGQPLISVADFSWALHQFPESGSIKVGLRREGVVSKLAINLPEGWRNATDISKRAGVWPMRAMAFGGMRLESLNDEERKARGIEAGKLALNALNVGEYGKHAAAKKGGISKRRCHRRSRRE